MWSCVSNSVNKIYYQNVNFAFIFFNEPLILPTPCDTSGAWTKIKNVDCMSNSFTKKWRSRVQEHRVFLIFVLYPHQTDSYPVSFVSLCFGAARKNRNTSWQRWGEEMKRTGVCVWGGLRRWEQKIERSANRLCWNKACWGHQRRRRVGGVGWSGGAMCKRGYKQTINTVSPKGKQENEDVTRVLILCPYSTLQLSVMELTATRWNTQTWHRCNIGHM